MTQQIPQSYLDILRIGYYDRAKTRKEGKEILEKDPKRFDHYAREYVDEKISMISTPAEYYTFLERLKRKGHLVELSPRKLDSLDLDFFEEAICGNAPEETLKKRFARLLRRHHVV